MMARSDPTIAVVAAVVVTGSIPNTSDAMQAAPARAFDTCAHTFRVPAPSANSNPGHNVLRSWVVSGVAPDHARAAAC